MVAFCWFELIQASGCFLSFYPSTDPYLIQFEFIQVSQESVHSLLSHYFHGCPQSFKGSITYLWSGVIYLLRWLKKKSIDTY